MGDEVVNRRHMVLDIISRLPRKMLSLKDYDNMTEFVLYELCHKNCFNFEKAAYFVDNPDFDCLKGVVGLCRSEACVDNVDIWKDPHSFSTHMHDSPFNKKVRSLLRPSFQRQNEKELDKKVINDIAQELALSDPGYYSWNMKHDNHGLLVYERTYKEGDSCDIDYVLNGLSLLGFCPIF